MDIRHYFNSLDFSSYYIGENTSFEKRSLGNLIERNNLKLSENNLKSFDVAIIGTPMELKTPNKGTAEAPSKMRKSLYSLSSLHPKLKLVDLGDIKRGKTSNSTYYAIRDVLEYLLELEITVIVLGGGQEVSVGISRAFSQKKDFILSSVDPYPDLDALHQLPDSTNYISKIIKQNPDLFCLNFIGYQSFFVPNQLISQIREMGHNVLRLGNLRTDITLVEPFLRGSDFLSFDFSAIRQSDSPGYFNPNPNGINGEEACQISRFAGLSDKMKVFGLFEANPRHDPAGVTSKLAAQMIWYFLDGFLQRKNENPDKKDARYIEYSVHVDELKTPIVFYQNRETERWWIQISQPETDHVVIPCHINDYKSASSGEIPEIWWQMIRKLGKIPK